MTEKRCGNCLFWSDGYCFKHDMMVYGIMTCDLWIRKVMV